MTGAPASTELPAIDRLDNVPACQIPEARVLAALGTNRERGLSSGEAGARLRVCGPNELPVEPGTPAWRSFLAQFQNPLTVLLVVAAAVSLLAWIAEHDTPVPYEALVIIGIVMLNAALGWYQERKAEQAVAALRAMSAPTARVLRDGSPCRVLAAEIVPGDVLFLDEGDTVAADGRVLEAVALRVTEAALTGESVPVSKEPRALSHGAPIAEQTSMVFAGTAISAGNGIAVATATGAHTEVGKIADTLQRSAPETTPLQRDLNRVGRILGTVVLAVAIVMAVVILAVEENHSFHDVMDVLLLAASLAVAAVPEGLTAVTTIILSIGIQRMSKRNVIVRKLSAVEALGCTTDICSDKTGTLTRNEMTVRSVVTASGRAEMTGHGYDPAGEILLAGQPLGGGQHLDEIRRLFEAGVLVNNATLGVAEGHCVVHGDPTEGAILVAARKLGIRDEELRSQFKRIREVPFSSARKLMTTVHRASPDTTRAIIVSKGAPDVLLRVCTHERAGEDVRPLTQERRASILAEVDALASEALRTLGIASGFIGRDRLRGRSDSQLEEELTWLGVVGMIDPPRPEALEAVRVAKRAGIRPIMITGDHPRTAEAIALELGIAQSGDRAVTGTQLDQMDQDGVRNVVSEATVFARVAPEHKLQIVKALQSDGRVVAMTGDGVNDAPALKAADIGISMGQTGTDVSRQTADMILTDDNFASIVAAIEEGRAIVANIRKFLLFLLSSNMGEVLVMFMGVIAAGQIGLVPLPGSAVVAPLVAVQILWINLLTDAAPALALGVDPGRRDQMTQPPRAQGAPVIDGTMWLTTSVVGMVMAVGTLLVIDACLPGGLIDGSGYPAHAQAMALTVLVIFQLFNVFNARSARDSALRKPFGNPWIWVAIVSSLALQTAVVYVPALQQAFNTVPLSATDWPVCVLVGSSVIFAGELLKMVLNRREALLAY